MSNEETATEIQAILEEHGIDGQPPELIAYLQEHAGEPWYKAGQGFADLAAKIGAGQALDEDEPEEGPTDREQIIAEHKQSLDLALSQHDSRKGTDLHAEWATRRDEIVAGFATENEFGYPRNMTQVERTAAMNKGYDVFEKQYGIRPDVLGPAPVAAPAEREPHQTEIKVTRAPEPTE